MSFTFQFPHHSAEREAPVSAGNGKHPKPVDHLILVYKGEGGVEEISVLRRSQKKTFMKEVGIAAIDILDEIEIPADWRVGDAHPGELITAMEALDGVVGFHSVMPTALGHLLLRMWLSARQKGES